jgi:hypothetical protein
MVYTVNTEIKKIINQPLRKICVLGQVKDKAIPTGTQKDP